jgi:hypothetical protein
MPSDPRYTATVRDHNGEPHIVLAATVGGDDQLWLTFPEWRELQIEGNRAMHAVITAEAAREPVTVGTPIQSELQTAIEDGRYVFGRRRSEDDGK